MIAFDPSLLNLGVSVGVLGIDGVLVVEHVETLHPDRLVDKYNISPDWDADVNMQRAVMLEFIVDNYLSGWNPDVMVIELPIFNGNPKTLQTQMKAIVTLERAAIRHSSKLKTNIVELMPNVIKAGVGVDVKVSGSDKTAITRALNTLVGDGKIRYINPDHLPNAMDDHANDSVAMLYTQCVEMLDGFS